MLAPAISYAQNGHPLVERANATIKTVEKLFRDHWPTSAAIYLPDGKPAETGKLFTNTTLAATYTRVLKEAESAGGDRVAQIEKARKVWSQGFVAAGHRHVLPHAGGDGRQRLAAQGRADRPGHGDVAGRRSKRR